MQQLHNFFHSANCSYLYKTEKFHGNKYTLHIVMYNTFSPDTQYNFPLLYRGKDMCVIMAGIYVRGKP